MIPSSCSHEAESNVGRILGLLCLLINMAYNAILSSDGGPLLPLDFSVFHPLKLRHRHVAFDNLAALWRRRQQECNGPVNSTRTYFPFDCTQRASLAMNLGVHDYSSKHSMGRRAPPPLTPRPDGTKRGGQLGGATNSLRGAAARGAASVRCVRPAPHLHTRRWATGRHVVARARDGADVSAGLVSHGICAATV